ncbi:hypothetical protein MRB53_038316 [Persea americana]|nr:hypothetical protein MRB53_038316 [Persea americana]
MRQLNARAQFRSGIRGRFSCSHFNSWPRLFRANSLYEAASNSFNHLAKAAHYGRGFGKELIAGFGDGAVGTLY